VAVGTETSGSILSAGTANTANMDVGIKPTLGLVSHFRRSRPAQPY
jgi:hypothetical protein